MVGPTTRPYVAKLMVAQTLYLACDAAQAFTLHQTMLHLCALILLSDNKLLRDHKRS